MLFRYLPAAAVVAAAFATMSHAQGRPPAELPPAGFVGQQYVDSRGCVYIRAGHGGQVNWVARIDRARRPICGQTPSQKVIAEARRELAAPAPVVAPAAAPAPVQTARAATPSGRAPAVSQYAPPPVTYGKPQPLARPAPVAAAASAAAPSAAPIARHAEAGGHGHWPRVPGWPSDNGNQINPQGVPAQGGVLTPHSGGHPPLRHRSTGCPEDAPYGRIYDLTDGRNVMLCATKPHTLRNMTESQARRHIERHDAAGRQVASAAARPDLMTPPPGYRAAWRDDRLNPARGERSAQGRQQMAQIWTEETPAELRDPAYAKPDQARVSSRGQVAPPAVTGARFVQVGSFGQPGNASRAVAKLQGLGLPVQVSRGSIKGKPVQVVRAGPFASEAEASQALAAARRNGFGDAILRR